MEKGPHSARREEYRVSLSRPRVGRASISRGGDRCREAFLRFSSFWDALSCYAL